MEKALKKFSFEAIFLISLIALDQLLKHLIRSQGGFYICNPNIAWGIIVSPVVFWIVWGAIIASILFFCIYGFKISNFQFLIYNKIQSASGRTKFSLAFSIPAMFILSGAISNIVDRIQFGCVVDYVSLPFWPVFNLADVFITFGAVFLLVKCLKL